MTFDPMTERGIPLERQLRSWSELNVTPYDSASVHPYTRTRAILMNGVEVEAIINSHQAARRNSDLGLKQVLAQVRRVEQQQQKAVNWLLPGEESNIAVTIGYEQVAVDLTAWIARHEPDPYLKQVYDFGLLEDFDHLYRYANLMDLMGESRKAHDITGGLTEILPGRPTIFEHRHPNDDLRRPMTKVGADRQSMLNGLTLVSAEQQTMNYYMNVGNRPTDPLARALYLEIAQIEEQHVSHYESILDPTLTWMENWVLHEFHECWLYWSCMTTEEDARIRALWELHLAMEVEHLRIACEMMKSIDRKDPAELLPDTRLQTPMTFEENKSYVRQILADQVDLTAWDSEFVPVGGLPEDHRYFDYQAAVNAGGSPTEQVIEQHRERFGEDYRSVSQGDHPIAALRPDAQGAQLDYAQRVGPMAAE